jgi:hypothetical protein
MIAIKHYIEQSVLYWAIPFLLKKVSSCTNLMAVLQSGSIYKSHGLHFLGDFCNFPIPKVV